MDLEDKEKKIPHMIGEALTIQDVVNALGTGLSHAIRLGQKLSHLHITCIEGHEGQPFCIHDTLLLNSAARCKEIMFPFRYSYQHLHMVHKDPSQDVLTYSHQQRSTTVWARPSAE